MRCINASAYRIGQSLVWDVTRVGEGLSVHTCRVGDGICVRTGVVCTPTRTWVQFLTLDGRLLDRDGNVFTIRIDKDSIDMDFRSKYTGAQIEALLDKINNGDFEVEEILVDSELSLTSENPVQNKVITEALHGIDSDVDKLIEDVTGLDDKVQEADSTFTWTFVE